MSPTFAYGKGGKLYRYYVSAPLQQGRGRAADNSALRRISGAAIEDQITAALARLLPGLSEDLLTLPTRVEIHMHGVDMLVPLRLWPRMRSSLGPGDLAAPDAADPSQLRLSLSLRLQTRGGRTEILVGSDAHRRLDFSLIKALRAAHAMLDTDRTGAPSLAASPVTSHRRRLIRLAFLAPDLQRAILAGRQPPAMTLARLMLDDIPLCWSEQRRLYGLIAANAQQNTETPLPAAHLLCLPEVPVIGTNQA